jgi:hypothetical protein
VIFRRPTINAETRRGRGAERREKREERDPPDPGVFVDVRDPIDGTILFRYCPQPKSIEVQNRKTKAKYLIRMD